MRRFHSARRGSSQVQLAVIIAVIALVVLGAVASLGNNTSSKLQETAVDVADPSHLSTRFAPASP